MRWRPHSILKHLLSFTHIPAYFNHKSNSTKLQPLSSPMQDLTPTTVAIILCVKALGYYIFRGANGQKDAFR